MAGGFQWEWHVGAGSISGEGGGEEKEEARTKNPPWDTGTTFLFKYEVS